MAKVKSGSLLFCASASNFLQSVVSRWSHLLLQICLSISHSLSFGYSSSAVLFLCRHGSRAFSEDNGELSNRFAASMFTAYEPSVILIATRRRRRRARRRSAEQRRKKLLLMAARSRRSAGRRTKNKVSTLFVYCKSDAERDWW